VSDYANRHWAGLVSGFYAPRWAAWLARLRADLAAGRAYDAAAWRLECLALTQAWVAGGGGGAPAEPAGDAVAAARAALDKWGGLAAVWASPPVAVLVPAPQAPALAPEPAPAAELAAAVAAEAAAVGAAAAAAAVAATAAAAGAPLSPSRPAQAALA
jgi:hypothetical protein